MSNRLDAVANRLIDAAVAAGFNNPYVRAAGDVWIKAYVIHTSVCASRGDSGEIPPHRTPTIGVMPAIDADLYVALAEYLDCIAVRSPPTRPMFAWEGDVVSLSDLRAAMRDRLPVAEAWVAMVWRLAADGFGLRTG